MTEASAGVQYSEDGQFWWDGTDWQPVDTGDAGSGSDAGSDSTSDSSERVFSEDGQFWWDGTDWQPVEEQPTDGGDGETSEPEIDFSNYPLIQGIWESTSVEEWLQYIGVDPEEINAATQ
jgi:hypothetical protein